MTINYYKWKCRKYLIILDSGFCYPDTLKGTRGHTRNDERVSFVYLRWLLKVTLMNGAEAGI